MGWEIFSLSLPRRLALSSWRHFGGYSVWCLDTAPSQWKCAHQSSPPWAPGLGESSLASPAETPSYTAPLPTQPQATAQHRAVPFQSRNPTFNPTVLTNCSLTHSETDLHPTTQGADKVPGWYQECHCLTVNKRDGKSAFKTHGSCHAGCYH